jgi:hypothetical protein
MYRFLCLTLLALLATSLIAQTPSQSGGAVAPENDPSGMYSFLKEGEYVQLTMEDGELSGFISRFGDSDSDRGQFIDQFFSKGSLKGDHVSFTTKTIHGVWYEFDGTVQKQPGKQPNQEGYRLLKGTLKQHSTDAKGGDKARERTVELKSFPEGVSRP